MGPSIHSRAKLVRRVLLVSLALGGLGCEADQPWFGPREVDVAPARRATVAETLDLPARLEATTRVDVVARTEGYLLERTFEDGTEVEQDRVLFSLQSDAQRARVEAARAERERAEKALDRASAADRSAAEAAVRAANAEVELAEIEESYTTLRAPISGRIDEHPIDVGNLVTKGDRLATIVQLDPIRLSFDVPEDHLSNVLAAQRDGPVVALAVKPDGTVHDRAGRIDAIGGEIDPERRTVTARAPIANPRMDLAAGRELTARLVLRWFVDVVLVPESAVRAGDEPFVLVVGGEDRIERRPVRLGPTIAGERVVLEGVEPDELVVVGRTAAALPGRRIQPRPKEIPPQPTPALAPLVAPPPRPS